MKRGRTLLVAAAVVLIGLVGGGLVVFHDRIFGESPKPRTTAPAHDRQ